MHHKLKQNNFLVYGLGVSGKSAVTFLLSENKKVFIGDDNKNSIISLQKEINQNLKDQSHNLHIIEDISSIGWDQIDALILAAGIPTKYPQPHLVALGAQQNNCPIICDVELLYLVNQDSSFIGITGTNGKSTTTALIGHIFNNSGKKYALGGNIGIGALDLPQLQENYILEMSSYQLDLINQTRFHIASLLNITPDHLDRHGGLEGYIESKKKIFLKQQEGDFAIIDIDNENSFKIYKELEKDQNFKAKLVPISTKKPVKNGIFVGNGKIYNNLNENISGIIDVEDNINLRGEHNAQNIAFAFANCFLSGIANDIIIKSIKSFWGLKHRMEFVDKVGNINFINDSKATNDESTQNALKCYDNIYWILGGKAKEGGISSLEKYFPKIKYAFLIGESSDNFAKAMEGKVEYSKCKTLDSAFELALQKALIKDSLEDNNILLSPACASFDQWKSFEERGNFFCQLVKNFKNDR